MVKPTAPRLPRTSGEPLIQVVGIEYAGTAERRMAALSVNGGSGDDAA